MPYGSGDQPWLQSFINWLAKLLNKNEYFSFSKAYPQLRNNSVMNM